MKLIFSGWQRDLGPTLVVDRKIEIRGISDVVYPLPPKLVRLVRKLSGRWKTSSLQIVTKTSKPITLNGNYAVSIEMSENEILVLLGAIYSDFPAEEIAQRIMKARSDV